VNDLEAVEDREEAIVIEEKKVVAFEKVDDDAVFEYFWRHFTA
jgi:hypothetical protein